ncbi:MAG: T9SS type A sorting domain-containing protein [Lentimicrobiaceae bacterium]|jgi:hypothetical protein|nr:T9SS type A sorting domain-containing protein [Lentimicrobiaceae bacterium]
MKRKTFVQMLLFVVFLLLMQHVHAQNYMFYFDYDASGNRIHRWWAEMEQMKSSESLPFTLSDTIPESLLDSTSVYPNPTRGSLTVSLAENPEQGVQYHLYDQRGQILEQGKLYKTTTLLDIGSYPDGLYFLLLIADRSSTTYKIIKLL